MYEKRTRKHWSMGEHERQKVQFISGFLSDYLIQSSRRAALTAFYWTLFQSFTYILIFFYISLCVIWDR